MLKFIIYIYIFQKPTLYNHISDVLPTALIIIDDYVPENIVLGLECLYQIIQHTHLVNIYIM